MKREKNVLIERKTYVDGENIWILLNIEADQMCQRTGKLCVA